MKINRLLVIIIIFAVVILVSVVVYKMVIVPAQLKKEYVSCVENAESADYERWQGIEREIAEKDALVKKLGIEADERYDKFTNENNLEKDYIQCAQEYEDNCNKEILSNLDLYVCNYRNAFKACVPKVRSVIYEDVQREQNELQDLYKKRDENGEILKKELEECEKHFKMFSKSY